MILQEIESGGGLSELRPRKRKRDGNLCLPNFERKRGRERQKGQDFQANGVRRVLFSASNIVMRQSIN